MDGNGPRENTRYETHFIVYIINIAIGCRATQQQRPSSHRKWMPKTWIDIRSYIFSLWKSSLVAMGRPGVDESSPMVPVFHVFLLQPTQLQVFLYTARLFGGIFLFPRTGNSAAVLVWFGVVFLFSARARGRTSKAGHISMFLHLPLVVALCSPPI